VGRHQDIFAHKTNAKNSDQGFAAVIKDLKSRGLWKDTLVVCGSEFGRTPVREVGGAGQGVKRGRDHNPFGYTMWLPARRQGRDDLRSDRRIRIQSH